MPTFPPRRGRPPPINSLFIVLCPSWCQLSPRVPSHHNYHIGHNECKPTLQGSSLFLPLLLLEKSCLSLPFCDLAYDSQEIILTGRCYTSKCGSPLPWALKAAQRPFHPLHKSWVDSQGVPYSGIFSKFLHSSKQ